MNMKRVAEEVDKKAPTRLHRALELWADFVYRHCALVLAVGLLLTALLALPASRVDLIWGEEALFPLGDSKIGTRSEFADRIGGAGLLFGVIEGGELRARKSFADDLAARLEERREGLLHIGEDPLLRYVFYKLPLPFFEARRLLYLQVEDILHIEGRLKLRMEQERLKHNPFYINFEEMAEPEVDISFRDLQDKYNVKRFREYSLSEDESVLAMVFKPTRTSSDMAFSQRFISWVKSSGERLLAGGGYPGVSLSLGGPYVVQVRQRASLHQLSVSALTAFLLGVSILVLMLLRHFRPVLMLLLSVLAANLWMLAIVWFFYDSLTFVAGMALIICTGFATAWGLLLLHHYFQARRRNLDLNESLILAIRRGGAPTLLGGIAASACLFILASTELTDYRMFGTLGGIGMLLMPLAVFSLLPAILILWEKSSRMVVSSSVLIMNAMPRKMPRRRAILFIGLLTGILAILFIIQSNAGERRDWCTPITRCCEGDPCPSPLIDFNYDFTQFQDQDPITREVQGKFRRVVPLSHEPIFVLAPDRTSLRAFAEAAEAASRKPDSMIQSVSSIGDLVPNLQQEKRTILRRMDQLATKEQIAFLDHNIRRRIDEVRPLLHPPVVTLFQLPSSVIRAFSQQPRGTETLLTVLERALSQAPDHLSKEEWEQTIGRQLDIFPDREIRQMLAGAALSELSDLESGGIAGLSRAEMIRELLPILQSCHKSYFGTVAYIYPRIDTFNGQAALKISRELDAILEHHPLIELQGKAMDLGRSLNVIPEMSAKLLLYMLTALLLIAFLALRGPLKALMVLIPILSAISLSILVMGIFGLKWSLYTFMVLPFVIGAGIEMGVRVTILYEEKRQIGALPTVVHAFPQLLILNLALSLSLMGWLFADQANLAAIATSTIVGLWVCGMTALTLLPVVLEEVGRRR